MYTYIHRTMSNLQHTNFYPTLSGYYATLPSSPSHVLPPRSLLANLFLHLPPFRHSVPYSFPGLPFRCYVPCRPSFRVLILRGNIYRSARPRRLAIWVRVTHGVGGGWGGLKGGSVSARIDGRHGRVGGNGLWESSGLAGWTATMCDALIWGKGGGWRCSCTKCSWHQHTSAEVRTCVSMYACARMYESGRASTFKHDRSYTDT